MKLSKRFFSLILALLLSAGVCSCSSDNGEKTDTDTVQADSVNTDVTNDPNSRDNAKDNLPTDLNFDDSSIRILYRGIDAIAQYDLIGTDNSGDLVFDAVHQRNRKVEERLGIVFDMIPSTGSSISDVKSQIIKTVSSGSDDYDIIVGTGNTLPQSGIIEYLCNLADDEYLDFEQPWWWNDAMNELSININRRYYLIGDFLLYNMMSTGAFYFNKEIYTDTIGDPNELYNTVLEGNWTLDKLSELIKITYQDLNGNTKADADDLYGMVTYSGSGAYHFQYATDIPSYTRDENGFPVISSIDDRSISFVNKMIDIYNLTGCRTGLSEAVTIESFANGKTLFLPYRLSVSFNGAIRAMTTDFGIIPYPKLDDVQQDYITMIHDCSSDAAVPVTNTKLPATTAALEALCAEAYRSVTEKFYETALKTKYVRDDVSSQIIDIIHDSATKNFMAEYASLLGGIGHSIFTCIENGNNTLASNYEKSIIGANKKLAKLIEQQSN